MGQTPDVAGRDTSASSSRQRGKRIWCVSSVRCSVASGRRAPPERDRRAHICQLEAPRTPEIRQLAREPHSAMPKRLGTSTRIRVVRQRIAGRRRRLPPPPLEPERGDPRRDPREAHAAAQIDGKLIEAVQRRHRRDERHTTHPLGRDRGNRERVRTARRPADHAEPLDLQRADEPLRPLAQRARTHRRTTPVERQQADAELRCDPVVRMPREPRVAAAVQIDDRRSTRITDVVDAQRETTSVARIPSAR